MASNTIFRYASLTKAIVSAAALALVERQVIHLEEPVTTWLPEFRPRTADGREPLITVRHLLTHTAGLVYGFLQPDGGSYRAAGVSDGFDAVPPQGLSMAEQLRRVASVPLAFAPGTAWHYSVGLDILGELLARASGKALDSLVAELVTAPLGMADAGFRVTDERRLATPYADERPPRRMAEPDAVEFNEGTLEFSPARIFRSDAFLSGGAGMAGTAAEYLAFLEAIRTGGGAILGPESARRMMSNQIGDLRVTTEATAAWGFGFGGAVLLDPKMAELPQAYGTWKWGGVYGNHWYVDPRKRMTVVALTNTAVEGMAGAFREELMRAIYAE
jgi:CubicO group peptidase (beta-lactamase class C family)